MSNDFTTLSSSNEFSKKIQLIASSDRTLEAKKSFKFSRSTIISKIFFNSFKRFNFFTSLRALLNIFCSRFFRKRFCSRRRFNFDNFERASSFAISHATSIFNFSRFNFFIALSMSSKWIIDFASSYFFSTRIHFSHFRDKKNKRHFFWSRAQRIQNIMTTILFWDTRTTRTKRAWNLKKNMKHDREWISSRRRKLRKRDNVTIQSKVKKLKLRLKSNK